MQKASKDLHRILIFICCFLFFLFVMLLTPPASDDLEFSALRFESFSEFLSYVLYYGNGRVMGNITAVTLNVYPTAGAIVKAFVLTGLVFLLPAVLRLKGIAAYLLSFLLVVGIDSNLFGEVYTWTSGFSNYIPPIVIALSIILLLNRYRKTDYAFGKVLICGYILVFGFLSQLFVEHSSGVNVLLAFCAVVMSFACPEWKSIRLPALLWMVASVCGIALMLAVPKLFYLAGNRAEGYQTFNLAGIVQIIYSCIRNGIRLANFYLGSCSLIVCVGGFLTIYLGRSKRSEKLNSLLSFVNFTAFAYLLLMTMMTVDHWNGRHAMVHHAVSTVFVMIPFVVWGVATLGLADRTLRAKLLALLAFAVISLLPLLVVSPTPNRLIFQSYVFVALAVLLCSCEVLGTMDESVEKKVVSCCTAVSAVLVLMIGLIFIHAKDLAQLREEHILREMEAGADKIEVFAIPYDYVFWDDEWFLEYYYYYKNIGDIDFTVLELDPWGVKYLEENPY